MRTEQEIMEMKKKTEKLLKKEQNRPGPNSAHLYMAELMVFKWLLGSKEEDEEAKGYKFEAKILGSWEPGGIWEEYDMKCINCGNKRKFGEKCEICGEGLEMKCVNCTNYWDGKDLDDVNDEDFMCEDDGAIYNKKDDGEGSCPRWEEC